MNNLSYNTNLRYMRNKKATWMASTLFYKKSSREILIKNFTKTFGNDFLIKELYLKQFNSKKKNLSSSINFKKLAYKKNLKFWSENNSINLLKNNLNYIHKNNIMLLFLKQKPRRFFRLLYSRKVYMRYIKNYNKFNENIDVFLRYKNISNLLLVLYYNKYNNNLYKYTKQEQLIGTFLFFLKDMIYFNIKYFFFIKMKNNNKKQFFINFKSKKNYKILKNNFYIIGFLFFIKNDLKFIFNNK